jgi:hypothetical protein
MCASLLHGTEVKLKELLLMHYKLPQKVEIETLSVEELSAYKVMGCKTTLKITLSILV